MRGRRPLLVIVSSALIVAAVIGGIVLARQNGSARPTVRGPTPKASLILRGHDQFTGKPVDLAQFRRKPVVINLWASWCPGCYREADDLARFAAAHPDVGVIGVNVQDSKGGARGFYRRYGWTFPSIADPIGTIAARLRLQGMPTTVFLDPRHREVARIIGETNLAGFTEGLERAAGSR